MAKTILITGCSSGLGVALALGAAKNGHKVYATMRNLDKRRVLDAAAAEAGVDLEVRRLDVQDMASISAVVDEIIANDGRIDTLINNAGMGFVRTAEQASEEEMQQVTDINQMGVMRCTKAVLPHMRKARSGHVIAVSSVGGLVGQPFNEIYCATKFAVEGFIEGLASYVGPAFGINFTVVEPGGIASEFVNNVMAHLESTGGLPEDEYLPLFGQYRDTMGATEWEHSPYQTADDAAAAVLEVVESDDPPVRKRTSPWAEEICSLKTSADPDGKKMQAMVVSDFLGLK
ncbi:SDR family oxidoreductase [Parasphingorhabdus marina]|uniref:SDR family oxidoreductase n=1 Tax=Parasphingorhabdus marina TaxID=394732 RepID=UPI00194E718E|nr:SDR family oxidoreductase [Parasphingorhabdus marina]